MKRPDVAKWVAEGLAMIAGMGLCIAVGVGLFGCLPDSQPPEAVIEKTTSTGSDSALVEADSAADDYSVWDWPSGPTFTYLMDAGTDTISGYVCMAMGPEYTGMKPVGGYRTGPAKRIRTVCRGDTDSEQPHSTSWEFVTCPRCLAKRAEPSGYPLSVNMAVADLKAAFAAAVEVDSTATLLALVGLIQQHGLPVAPFGYGREMWRWPLAECGAFAVKYRVHYEADFIVDLPEFAVWVDTTRQVGSVMQVAGIDTAGRMGLWSVEGVSGAGVLDAYPLAEPCPGVGE